MPPLPVAEWDDRTHELIAQAMDGQVDGSKPPVLYTTLARHPGLFRWWMSFTGKLLRSKLPPRERELLTLRTLWNCQSAYEWSAHLQYGQLLGITNAEILAIAFADYTSFGHQERALLTAADELHRSSSISDETWSSLSDVYDEKQLIEIPMVVGHYHLIAFTTNALGIREATSDERDALTARNGDATVAGDR